MSFIKKIHTLLESLKNIDFIGLFLIRIYLFFVFWQDGFERVGTVDKQAGFLGTLGVPFPEIIIWFLICILIGGAALLLIGLFVRWASIPLLVVMCFAGYLVHYENGWHAEANGIEFAATYGLMLLILASLGGGKYLSLDYWVSNKK
tara:strand:- start:2446 stop:2886 length:441 start_codon:yes stop_codon:yes gene_type:complete